MSTKKKKQADVDPVEFLLEGEEVEEADRAVLEKYLTRDTVKSRVNDGVLKQSEFSRRMDEVAAREKELEEEEADLTSWRNDLMVWKQAKEEEFKTAKPTPTPEPDGSDDEEDDDMPKGKYLTQEQLEDILKEKLGKLTQGTQAGFSGLVGLTKFLQKANNKYYKEFGEYMDPDDFEKFYVENKHTDYDRAFNEFISPKMKEKDEESRKTELEKAREEGRREAMSGRIPGGDITSANRAPLLRSKGDKTLSEDEKVDRFATLLAGEQVEA